MLVDRNGKRLEPALVQVSRADVMMVHMPALRVRQGQPWPKSESAPSQRGLNTK
jgi:hypothetical protein